MAKRPLVYIRVDIPGCESIHHTFIVTASGEMEEKTKETSIWNIITV